jgi:tRNA-specific 2-thiouridylase
MVVGGVNWTLDAPPPDDALLDCKIRYKADAVPCTVHDAGEGSVTVRFSRALRDITPGQGAVFYCGDHCLGGGIIQSRSETERG